MKLKDLLYEQNITSNDVKKYTKIILGDIKKYEQLDKELERFAISAVDKYEKGDDAAVSNLSRYIYSILDYLKGSAKRLNVLGKSKNI